MPSYTWDSLAGRYRDTNTKRFVSRSVILKHVNRRSEQTKTYFEKQAKRLTSSNISLSQFQTLMIEELKRSHIQMGLLGAGGKKSTSARNYGAMGNRLKEEYGYLNGFMDAIAKGKLSKKQIIARAKMYGSSAAGAFYKGEQISRMENGAVLAKRSLDPNVVNHCAECPPLSTYGKWLSINLVVPPTRNCSCRNRCKCTIQYRMK